MINYNIDVVLIRADEHGSITRTPGRAVVGRKIDLPIDTEIEEGDLIEETLPSGKTRTLRATKVTYLRSPFGSDNLNHVSVEYESAKSTPPRPQSSTAKFELESLHAVISKASGSLFRDGHFAQAVFEAFRAVESRVQKLTDSHLSGRPLMSASFNPQSPVLDVAISKDRRAADEREGFMFLFMGAFQGLRNPRAHGDTLPDTQEEALEYLAVASMLMRRLDFAEVRLTASK